MLDNEKVIQVNEGKRRALERLYKLSYWFSNEMLKHIAEEEEFEKKCKEAEASGETVIMVSAATNNKNCMQHCLRATNEAINYLRNKENAEYLELWQLDGINAMFDRCKKDSEIHYDIPYAIQGILGMWDELKKATSANESADVGKEIKGLTVEIND